jgi:hypothetical protein
MIYASGPDPDALATAAILELNLIPVEEAWLGHRDAHTRTWYFETKLSFASPEVQSTPHRHVPRSGKSDRDPRSFFIESHLP